MNKKSRYQTKGPAKPWTDCKICNSMSSVITHTKTKDKWCMKCQVFSSGDVQDVENGSKRKLERSVKNVAS